MANDWRTFKAALLVVAAVASCGLVSDRAEAAYGETYLQHNTSTVLMSGFTGTYFEYYDEIAGQFYYDPCECYVTYASVAEINALMRNPLNAIAFSVPPIFSQFPSSGVQVNLENYPPNMPGTWRAVGLHYVNTVYYINGQQVATQRAPVGGTDHSAAVPCIVPTGEVTVSDGWNATWPTIHEFRGRLAPAGHFSGGQVTEFQPSGGSDGCYDPVSMTPDYRYGLTGGTWTVSGDEWAHDSIGFEPSGIEFIRSSRAQRGLPMPCEVSVPQHMRYLSCGTPRTYKSHNIGYRLGVTALTVFRDAVAVGTTWPISRAALRSQATGQWVAAEGGGGSYLVANRGAIGPWEQFGMSEVVPASNLVTLRAANGQYVAAENGGGGAVNANRNSPGPWEEFTVEHHGGGYIALRTLSGHYLRALVPGGVIDAVATSVGPWELFERIPQ